MHLPDDGLTVFQIRSSTGLATSDVPNGRIVNGNPTMIVGTARSKSGQVMIGGLSWAWSYGIAMVVIAMTVRPACPWAAAG